MRSIDSFDGSAITDTVFVSMTQNAGKKASLESRVLSYSNIAERVGAQHRATSRSHVLYDQSYEQHNLHEDGLLWRPLKQWAPWQAWIHLPPQLLPDDDGMHPGIGFIPIEGSVREFLLVCRMTLFPLSCDTPQCFEEAATSYSEAATHDRRWIS